MNNLKRGLWIPCGIFLVLLILGVFLPYFYLKNNRPYQEIWIDADGYQLKGYLGVGKEPEGKWVILTHGNRKDGQSHSLYEEIRGNIPESISVLAIDFRGFGGSSNEGLEQSDDIINRTADMEYAVDYLVNNFGVNENQLVLIGHSLGASRVMRVALDQKFRMVIPIGLGDWDSLLADPKKIEDYKQKYYSNTGVQITSDRVIAEGKEFSSEFLFSQCPNTPVWLIFSSRDEGRKPLSPLYQEARSVCGEDIRWSVIPFANHMYGTDGGRFPPAISKVVSRIYLSFLMLRLNQILNSS